jgi:CHAD domain-containing protein
MNGHSELLIRQRLQTLRRTLPGVRQGSATAIHQARVATRRLREALPLVAAGGRGRKLQRRVRAITRALGPVRELDVAAIMLDEFTAARDASHDTLAPLRRAVADERQRLLDQLLHALERADVDKLAKKAIAAARDADERPAVPGGRTRDAGQRSASSLRAARRAERLQASIENAAGLYLPDRLHEVRIGVKKLRYAIEVLRELDRPRAARRSTPAGARTRGPAAALRVLKQAQELLGRMHDLEVLIARTRGIQGSPSAPPLRVSADLDRFVRGLETECRQLHGTYIAARPALLAVCAEMMAKRGRRHPAA